MAEDEGEPDMQHSCCFCCLVPHLHLLSIYFIHRKIFSRQNCIHIYRQIKYMKETVQDQSDLAVSWPFKSFWLSNTQHKWEDCAQKQQKEAALWAPHHVLKTRRVGSCRRGVSLVVFLCKCCMSHMSASLHPHGGLFSPLLSRCWKKMCSAWNIIFSKCHYTFLIYLNAMWNNLYFAYFVHNCWKIWNPSVRLEICAKVVACTARSVSVQDLRHFATLCGTCAHAHTHRGFRASAGPQSEESFMHIATLPLQTSTQSCIYTGAASPCMEDCLLKGDQSGRRLII